MTTDLAAPTTAIDLRSVAPRDRHTLIFARFDALPMGQALELVSDHDPQPLRVRFEELAFGQYDWRDLESGPASWRVRIGRSGVHATSAAGDSCCSGGACCG